MTMTKVKTIDCWYKELVWTRKTPARICPICKGKISHCGAFIIINNFKLFPNTVVHASCAYDLFGGVTPNLIYKLQKDYTDFLAAKEKYKAWT